MTASQAAEGYGSENVRVLQSRYLALGDELDDPVAGTLARLYLASAYMSRGESTRSISASDGAVERADALGIPLLQLATVSVQCGCRQMAGEYRSALEASDRGLALFAEHPSPWLGSNIHPAHLCYFAGGLSLWTIGKFAAAIERATAGLGLQLQGDTIDPMGRGTAQLGRGWLYFLNCDPSRAIEACQAALRIAEVQGMRWLELSANAIMAAAAFESAPNDATGEALGKAIGTYETPTGPPIKHTSNAALARALHHRGDTHAALALIATEQEHAKRSGGSFCEEELYRSEAMIELDRGDTNAALDALERGIGLVESRSAPGWSIRLALPLTAHADTRPRALDVLVTAMHQASGDGTTRIERMARTAIG
jgi:tetratricopeptide (TPR) repeat protein